MSPSVERFQSCGSSICVSFTLGLAGAFSGAFGLPEGFFFCAAGFFFTVGFFFTAGFFFAAGFFFFGDDLLVFVFVGATVSVFLACPGTLPEKDVGASSGRATGAGLLSTGGVAAPSGFSAGSGNRSSGLHC